MHRERTKSKGPRLARAMVILGVVLSVSTVLAASAAAAPTADFTCSRYACWVLPGEAITFSATSNATQPNYRWDLNNDGVYGDQTGPTATQTFSAPGTYPVSLRVTDLATQQSTDVTHNVYVPGTASITCSATPSCDAIPVGSSVTVGATSNLQNPTYSWDFLGNGGSEATGATATYRYTQPGTYSIILNATGTGTGGQRASAVRNVTVVPTLHGSVACSPSCEVAPGTSVTFSASSDGHAPSYGWNYGSDISYGAPVTPRHFGSTWSQQFLSPGGYEIVVTVTDGPQTVRAYAFVNVSDFNQPLRIPRVLSAGKISATDWTRCHRLFSATLRGRCLTVARETVVIHLRQASVQLVPGEATRMWTFDGGFPGPTIRAASGHPLRVTYVNDLPRSAGLMTIHLHGDHHPSADDGQPDSGLIGPGASRTYTYPLTESGQPERAAFRWYHDHRMGQSGRDVWNGLAGMFILDDHVDSGLHLPSGNRDLPLMVTDRKFVAGNQLSYSSGSHPPGDGAIGDHILINGTFRPFLNVAAGWYRVRLLNASNWCSYNFSLTHQGSTAGGVTQDVDFSQIGTDGGLSPQRTERQRILLGPGERADTLVYFPSFDQKVYLQSTSDPGDSGTPACQASDSNHQPAPIMEFRITGTGNLTQSMPTRLRPLPNWAAAVYSPRAKVRAAHTFHLETTTDARGTHWTIDGKMYDPRRIDAVARLGTTTYWDFVNDSPVTHYMHIHEDECVSGSPSFAGTPIPDRVLKDTFRVNPHSTVRVACNFTDYTGVYMIHCHMLEHEDNAMMAQFLVVPRTATTRQIKQAISQVARTATQQLQHAGVSWAGFSKALWMLCHLGAYTSSA